MPKIKDKVVYMMSAGLHNPFAVIGSVHMHQHPKQCIINNTILLFYSDVDRFSEYDLNKKLENYWAISKIINNG